MAALLGLTGGLAAGKTVACEAFRGLGVYVCDADEVGRDLTAAGGAAVEAVLRAVGSGFVLRAVGDGFGSAAAGIDRAALRRAAFIDSSLREKLERVLHPLIFARMESELAANDGGAYKIASAPLLFETGMERRLRFDAGILAIDCIEATQLARAVGRGLDGGRRAADYGGANAARGADRQSDGGDNKRQNARRFGIGGDRFRPQIARAAGGAIVID